jgi:hypothetical protein
MRVIKPIPITDINLMSSSVVETAPALYSAVTNYGLNAQVSVAGAAGLRFVFKSLQAGNVGHDPFAATTWWKKLGETYQSYSAGATYGLGERVIDAIAHLVYTSLVAGNVGNALSDVTKWMGSSDTTKVPTNRFAMFDLLRDTKTEWNEPIVVTFMPLQRIDTLALLHLDGVSVVVGVMNGATQVYSRTVTIAQRPIFGWYDYFFKAFSTQENVVLFDLPPYTNAVITVTVTPLAMGAKVGTLLCGASLFLGSTAYDAVSDVLNFSTIERDFLGNINRLIPRRNVPITTQQLYVDKSRVQEIYNFREYNGGLPLLWSGLDDAADGYFGALLIFGPFKKFSINLKHPTQAVINLELEEV